MFARGGGQRIEGRAACSIVLVILGACSVGGGKNATALPDVAVARVHRADLSRTLVLTAEFRPFQDIDVHAKVAGFVKSILVDVGSRVKTGDLLAVLEIPELRDELHQTAASVHQSEEDVERAKAEIRQAESAYEVAHLGFTRLAGVAKSRPDLVAQQDLDDATGRDRVSEAQVATANASLAAAIAHLQEARANRARVQSLFDYSRIVAPFTGVVTKRYADTGSMIQAGTSSQTQAMPLVRLAQNDLLRLVIPVPESVVPSIRLGSPIEVQVPALRKNFTGSVARFADKVDMSTRTMHTELDVPNPALDLVPGMYATVSIPLGQKRQALAVPVQAIDRGQDTATVYFVSAEGRLKSRAVDLGIETPDQVEILSGLNENDLVVVGNRSQLRPGMAVRPDVVTAAAASGGT